MQPHSDDKKKKYEHLNTQKTQPPIYQNTRKKELKNLKKLENRRIKSKKQERILGWKAIRQKTKTSETYYKSLVT